MDKSLIISFIILIILTILGAVLRTAIGAHWVVNLVIFFTIAKFLIVGYQFMELKHAHFVWKFLLTAFGTVMGIILLVLL